jgi:hypothetical protein
MIGRNALTIVKSLKAGCLQIFLFDGDIPRNRFRWGAFKGVPRTNAFALSPVCWRESRLRISVARSVFPAGPVTRYRQATGPPLSAGAVPNDL